MLIKVRCLKKTTLIKYVSPGHIFVAYTTHLNYVFDSCKIVKMMMSIINLLFYNRFHFLSVVLRALPQNKKGVVLLLGAPDIRTRFVIANNWKCLEHVATVKVIVGQ